MQHNCISDGRTYAKKNFVPIVDVYKRQDLGIEISIPTEIYNRMADVEIKESESEGSQVIIKNISSMHLK